MTPDPNAVWPTYFISHGGGPWPFMDGPMRSAHATLEASLRDLPRQWGRTPRAVLLVSAHWEEPGFTVMGHAHPPMLYDYSGFPAHTYQVQYKAPGAPELAQQVQALARSAGLACRIDTERGFDHGMFAPMSVIYPDASVPVLQLSLMHGYDPQRHLAIGRALAPLRGQGVLIIGSGLSYHNMAPRGTGAALASQTFDAWLVETLTATQPEARDQRLLHWAQAPSARQAHPREDHLLPLMVALGAAHAEPGTRIYHEDAFLGGMAVSSFRFGAAPH